MTKKMKLKNLVCMSIIFMMIALVPLETAEIAFAAKKKAAAPKLKTLQYYQNENGTCNATLTWYSKKGYTYQILRKVPGGKFKVIAKKKAKGKTTKYINKKVGVNKKYIYTVRQYKAKRKKKISKYDKTGLQLMPRPSVSVDFQNLKANISWSGIERAAGYCVYRKVGFDGDYKLIATLDASARNFTEVYHGASGIPSGIMNADYFIDPSYNSLHYTVRPYYRETFKGTNKISWGLYSRDGDFHLEPPVVTSLTSSKIKWGNVPNAKSYRILKKTSEDGSWSTVKSVDRTSGTTMSVSLSPSNSAYYAVQAVSEKNRSKVYSEIEPGVTMKNRSSGYNILYFGDSITYGSPYKGTNSRHIFSYPNRIKQLTGMNYYNPSIPGSTYHWNENDNDDTGRYRIITGVVEKIRDGKNPDNYSKLDTANKESVHIGIRDGSTIEDYDIIIMAAGTNDYLDDTPLGASDSTDRTEFNGAFNLIMTDIETASKNRMESRKPGIQVVFVDLFYSDRTYWGQYANRNNRDISPNRIGLTLMDYQAELNNAYTRWSESPYLELFHFKTRDYGIVDNSNCPYRASDNLHFTKYAYALYGNALAGYLRDVVFSGVRPAPLSDTPADDVTTEQAEPQAVDEAVIPAVNESTTPAVEEVQTPVAEPGDTSATDGDNVSEDETP